MKILLFLLISCNLYAQHSGASLPGTCNPGAFFRVTGTGVISVCGNANVWTQIPNSSAAVDRAYDMQERTGTTLGDAGPLSSNGAFGSSVGNHDPYWTQGGGIGGDAIGRYVAVTPTAMTGDISWVHTFKAPVRDACPNGGGNMLGFYHAQDGSYTGWATTINQLGGGAQAYWSSLTGSWVRGAGTINVCDQNWHVLGGTVSGTTVKLYTDGTLDSTLTSNRPGAYSGPAYILGSPDNTNFIDGQVADIVIYNGVVLSGADMVSWNTLLQPAITAQSITQTLDITFPGNCAAQDDPTCFTVIPPNGRAKTPTLGYSSWNYNHLTTEVLAKVQAAKMVSTGLSSLFTIAGQKPIFFFVEPGVVGYDANSIPFSYVIPNGFVSFSSYISSLGMLFGNYTSASKRTCLGYYGSFGREAAEAIANNIIGSQFMWIDFCDASNYATQITAYGTAQTLRRVYQQISAGYQAAFPTGASPALAISPVQLNNDLPMGGTGWDATGANMDRYADDIADTFASVLPIVDKTIAPGGPDQIGKWTKPGYQRNADQLAVGNGMTCNEGRLHYNWWVMFTSPLFLSTNLSTISRCDLDTVSNTEVIAINQDAAVIQAVLVANPVCGDGTCEVWVKHLVGPSSQEWAVMFANRSSTTQTITITWNTIATALAALTPAVTFQTSNYPYCRDLWTHNFVGTRNVNTPNGGYGALATQYSTSVVTHASSLIRIGNTVPIKAQSVLF